MGGFIVSRKISTLNRSDAHSTEEEDGTFKKRGLSLKKCLDREQFSVRVYDKISISSENFWEAENGDFVVAVGTFIFDSGLGEKALKGFYQSFSGEVDFSRILGHFAVLILKNDQLHVFNDFNGIYSIFKNEDASIVSTSFLSIIEKIPTFTLCRQSVTEYILYGAVYGDATLVQEIGEFDSFFVHNILPTGKKTKKRWVSDPDTNEKSATLEERVEHFSSLLLEYFGILKTLDGNAFSSALSGGYDSRLLLALMRRVGIDPKLYVYGDDDAADVKVALRICRGERLDIVHRNKKIGIELTPEKVLGATKKQYHLMDGRGIFGGIDDGRDIESRIERTEGVRFQLNGGGGEIFRNFWKMPNCSMTVSGFVKRVYGLSHFEKFEMLPPPFDKGVFFEQLSSKILKSLDTENNRLSRTDIEHLYPAFRLKYWMGQNNVVSNTFSYALTPFSEVMFTDPALRIPLSSKNMGKFEAALICSIDEDLAKYPSDYGWNFFDPLPFKAIVKNQLKVHAKYFVKPLIPSSLLHLLSGNRGTVSHPYYLENAALENILEIGDMTISNYVNLGLIRDSDMLNRALTVELLLQKFYLR